MDALAGNHGAAASRKSTSSVRKATEKDWERHRQLIIGLYSRYGLEEVARKMRQDHGFEANKRQYVYKLGRWEVKKYKKVPSRSAVDGRTSPVEIEGRSPSPLFEIASTGKWPTTSRKQRQEGHQNGTLPCPFRLRNPKRFNVRHYTICALRSFPDISSLKRHVDVQHVKGRRVGHQCLRCGEQFTSPQELEHHAKLPPDRMCSVKSNPEDGITEAMRQRLADRTATKITTYVELWKLLFPEDDMPDRDTHRPPVELPEVEEAAKNMLRKSLLSHTAVSTQQADKLAKEIWHNLSEMTLQTAHMKKETEESQNNWTEDHTSASQIYDSRQCESPLGYQDDFNMDIMSAPEDGSMDLSDNDTFFARLSCRPESTDMSDINVGFWSSPYQSCIDPEQVVQVV